MMLSQGSEIGEATRLRFGNSKNRSSTPMKGKRFSPLLQSVHRGDSVVGIATRYGLDGPGIEFRRGRGFPHSSRPALGSTQPPI
jgi:hypothetical protein